MCVRTTKGEGLQQYDTSLDTLKMNNEDCEEPCTVLDEHSYFSVSCNHERNEHAGLRFKVRILLIISALWDQQYDTRGQLQGDQVQNKHSTGKPIFSVYPSRCVIVWQGHSHTLNTIFSFCFFKSTIVLVVAKCSEATSAM